MGKITSCRRNTRTIRASTCRPTPAAEKHTGVSVNVLSVEPSKSPATKQAKELNATSAWFCFGVATLLLLWRTVVYLLDLLNPANMYRAFGSFRISGWAASHHLNPFAIYPETYRTFPYLHGLGPIHYDVNLQPPILLPLFQILGHFGPRSGVIVYTLLSVAAFIGGTALLIAQLKGKIQIRVIFFLLFSMSVLDIVYLAQDYGFMFLLVCLVVYFIKSERTLATAICIGVLVSIKPNLGVWPILLFLANYKKLAVISTLTAIALTTLPIALYGPSIYTQWLHAYAVSDAGIFPSDISLSGIFTRLGYPLAGRIVAVLLFLALANLIRRNRPGQIEVGGVATCAGILCSPLGWFQYSVLAAPLFAASKRWGSLETWAAALLCFPDVEILFTGGGRLLAVLGALPYFVGVYLMLISFLRSPLNKSHPRAANNAVASH
jgi:alpha-1,2-mannosyltransferase